MKGWITMIVKQFYRNGVRPKGYIFRASVTIKGVTYYAKHYGHKAFRIPLY